MVAEQVSRSMEQESSGLTKSACELTSDPVNAELPWWSISTSLITCALPRP